jgi:hypothetical protein
MSVEQWVILALVILVPLLEGVARRWRTRTSDPGNVGPAAQLGEAPGSRRWSPLPNHIDDDVLHAARQTAIQPRPPLPPPLPQHASAPLLSLAGLPASRATSSSSGSGSLDGQKRVQRPLRRDPVAQWLRPPRNLRHAMVLAIILGPPAR